MSIRLRLSFIEEEIKWETEDTNDLAVAEIHNQMEWLDSKNSIKNCHICMALANSASNRLGFQCIMMTWQFLIIKTVSSSFVSHTICSAYMTFFYYTKQGEFVKCLPTVLLNYCMTSICIICPFDFKRSCVSLLAANKSAIELPLRNTTKNSSKM